MLSALLLLGCNITKKVPQDAYLFRSHDFKIEYEPGERMNRIERAQLEQVARIRPIRKVLFAFFPLIAYNIIDQNKLEKEVAERNKRTHQKNLEELAKQEEKNKKRIEKAYQRGDSRYKPYRAKLRDTLNPKTTIFTPRFSFKYIVNSFGEEPIILNPNLVHRSTDQIKLYLEKKGYYNAQVSDTIILNPRIGLRKRKGQAIVEYRIKPGKPCLIDSVYYEGQSERIHRIIDSYLSQNEILQKGQVFDRERLESLRIELARHLRNQNYFDFSANHILFKADTTVRANGVILGINILPRTMRSQDNRDSIVKVDQRPYFIGEVYFHISDTINYKGDYSKELKKKDLSVIPGQFYPTLDTFVYEPLNIRNANQRKATFLYNGEMNIRPDLLEMKNFLEHTTRYEAQNLDKSYNSILELDVFQTIQTSLVDRIDSGLVDVHYYLVPAKVQGFGFEPRATNSNGFLGVSSSINYRHKNVFKSGGKFIASLSAGIENQPPLVDADNTNKREQTFEFGPTMKLSLPGLSPISYLKFSKRQTTSTEYSTGFNHQRRREFDRQLFQFNYLWRWRSTKHQTFQMGLPLVSGFKFVLIQNQSEDFLNRINSLNDLFLKNAYSNQLIFNDFKLTYEYVNNKISNNKSSLRRIQLKYNLNLDVVGNTLKMFFKDSTQTLPDGTQVKIPREMFGVPFSQFVRIDNEIGISQLFIKGKSLNYRLQLGMGYVYGNSTTAMPFDYGFFAGGSNDNRGWRAREMTPGRYQYHLDPLRTLTQIGDIRLGTSIEYRFNIPLTKRFKGAVFSDAGNIWTLREDPNRQGAQFTKEFYKDIAWSTGLGLRLDLSFLIIRFDVGLPIHNPAMSPGGQWIWNSRELFESELDDLYGNTPERFSVPRPFTPKLHFGIGYPF